MFMEVLGTAFPPSLKMIAREHLNVQNYPTGEARYCRKPIDPEIKISSGVVAAPFPSFSEGVAKLKKRHL
jgi:hypothetical protein